MKQIMKQVDVYTFDELDFDAQCKVAANEIECSAVYDFPMWAAELVADRLDCSTDGIIISWSLNHIQGDYLAVFGDIPADALYSYAKTANNMAPDAPAFLEGKTLHIGEYEHVGYAADDAFEELLRDLDIEDEDLYEITGRERYEYDDDHVVFFDIASRLTESLELLNAEMMHEGYDFFDSYYEESSIYDGLYFYEDGSICYEEVA